LKNGISLQLNRRRTLALLGGAAALGALGESAHAASTCLSLAGAQTEGPYWVEENLNRSDIRTDPSDGSVRPGVLLNLTINLQEESGSNCGPLAGARVDVWHCDAGGTYSDETANNSKGRKYLRGYQISDDNGNVQFTTVYPGWYSGRTIHIHVRVRTYSGTTQIGEFVNQIFFDDAVSDAIIKTVAPYNTRPNRDTRNANDMVVTGTNNGSVVYAALTKTSAGYDATASIGVNLKTVSAAPAIASGGVVNGGSFVDGFAPGSWVAIFGTNLASSTHPLTASDLVNGNLPTSLAGVTVKINNQPAFLYYVSPTQINVQAPADTSAGSVQVTVTSAAGTSTGVTATLRSIAPAFFRAGNYVAAVRPDGAIIGASAPAKPGDVLEMFGTGFGPTTAAVVPGVIFQGSVLLSNTVTVKIGGMVADVSYVGLVGAGLNQINVTVPVLPSGEYPVVAEISGVSTQAGVLLKIQS
jgi:uncharacterized protein (TIGR03437 family)